MNYKQEIVNLINNEDIKTLLSNKNYNCGGTLLTYYLKEYTTACMLVDDDKKEEEFEYIYTSIKKIKNNDNFKKGHKGRSIQDTIKFVEVYEETYNFVGSANLSRRHDLSRTKLNKIVNENLDKYFKLDNEVKKEFDFQKTLTMGNPNSTKNTKSTMRFKSNTECLRILNRTYKKEIEFYNEIAETHGYKL